MKKNSNDSSNYFTSSNYCKTKVEEEGPIYANDQEELETYRSMKLPDGVLRILRDARKKQILEMMYNYSKLINIIIYFYLLFLKMYDNVLELRKYAGKKQHSVTCKSCRSSRSPIMYCRICTFRGHNFPDIIPVHTDVSRHPGCADQYQDDIEE